MKYVFFIAILILPLFASADPAGTYSCVERLNTVAKVVGAKPQRSKVSETFSLTLNSDGTTLSTNPAIPFPTHGAWSLAGKRLLLAPDQNDLVKVALYTCTQAKVSCTFIGATTGSSLTFNKPQTVFKGTVKSALSMLINGYMVNSSGTGPATCTKN